MKKLNDCVQWGFSTNCSQYHVFLQEFRVVLLGKMTLFNSSSNIFDTLCPYLWPVELKLSHWIFNLVGRRPIWAIFRIRHFLMYEGLNIFLFQEWWTGSGWKDSKRRPRKEELRSTAYKLIDENTTICRKCNVKMTLPTFFADYKIWCDGYQLPEKALSLQLTPWSQKNHFYPDCLLFRQSTERLSVVIWKWHKLVAISKSVIPEICCHCKQFEGIDQTRAPMHEMIIRYFLEHIAANGWIVMCDRCTPL